MVVVKELATKGFGFVYEREWLGSYAIPFFKTSYIWKDEEKFSHYQVNWGIVDSEVVYGRYYLVSKINDEKCYLIWNPPCQESNYLFFDFQEWKAGYTNVNPIERYNQSIKLYKSLVASLKIVEARFEDDVRYIIGIKKEQQ